MRLLIMGPQGVGKGTQASKISEKYSIPAISTGDIFRYNLKNHTELGKEASKYIDKGELVPDELTNRIVRDSLSKANNSGWILDGFPRNKSQVEALDSILKELGTPLDAVVVLTADKDVLLDRMKKRAEIEGRSDDTPEIMAKRLDIYDNQTKPLLDEYKNRGLLLEIAGVGDIDEISQEIAKKLEKLDKSK